MYLIGVWFCTLRAEVFGHKKTRRWPGCAGEVGRAPGFEPRGSIFSVWRLLTYASAGKLGCPKVA